MTNSCRIERSLKKTRVTKKLYIVFKYSKLLNKYKMCSHDLHIGQYTQCPSLILFTRFPLPRLKCPQTIHICFCLFLFCFISLFRMKCRCGTAVYWTKSTQTDRRYTWNTGQCRMKTSDRGLEKRPEAVGCWWCQQYVLTRERRLRHSVSADLLDSSLTSMRHRKRTKPTGGQGRGVQADGLAFSLFTD